MKKINATIDDYFCRCGGDYERKAGYFRSTDRHGIRPNFWYDWMGFRLARRG